MKKMSLLIAALHASALALTAGPGLAHAQNAQEIHAYMEALRTGTAEAMATFLTRYPNSALPGSEMGASIAAGIDPATAAVVGTPGSPAEQAAEDGVTDAAEGQGWGTGGTSRHGWRGNDHNASSRDIIDDGIY
jgi:hypothetical protein